MITNKTIFHHSYGKYFIFFILMSFFFNIDACTSPSTTCSGQVSDFSLNPDGSLCTKLCECNNQLYTGYCKKEKGKQQGICVSIPRGSCSGKGETSVCIPVDHSCVQGTKKCFPDYLTSTVWGDCICPPKPQEKLAESSQEKLNEKIVHQEKVNEMIAEQSLPDAAPDFSEPDFSAPDDKLPDVQCNISCSTNDDCRSHPDCLDKEYCKNNHCVESPAHCPSSCKNNNDCDILSCGKRVECRHAKCEEPRCPSSCQVDDDCNLKDCGKRTSCVNHLCVEENVCPTTCLTDEDCRLPACGTRQKCSKDKGPKKCVELKQCPSTCQENLDCQILACQNKRLCVNGKCTEDKCSQTCTTDLDCKKIECGIRRKCGPNGQCIVPAQCPTPPVNCSPTFKCTTSLDCQSPGCGKRIYCSSSNCCIEPPMQCPITCNKDDECQIPACGARRICDVSNHKCVEPSSCQAGCFLNVHCRIQSCGKKTYCDLNIAQCTIPPSTCPKTCMRDNDCDIPACGSNKNCIQGKCANACDLAPCYSDLDCRQNLLCAQENKLTCQNGHCVATCPTSCSSNADCPSRKCGLRLICKNNQCINGFCPEHCQVDSDCAPASCGMATKCIFGICQEPNKCPIGCQNDQDCTPCNNGATKYKCEVSNNPQVGIHICVIAKQCPTSCKTNKDCLVKGCQGAHYCNNGKCERPPMPPTCEGQNCQSDKDCQKMNCLPGLVCDTMTSKCVNQCSQLKCQKDDDCKTNAACQKEHREVCKSGQCVQYGTCPNYCFIDRDCLYSGCAGFHCKKQASGRWKCDN